MLKPRLSTAKRGSVTDRQPRTPIGGRDVNCQSLAWTDSLWVLLRLLNPTATLKQPYRCGARTAPIAMAI